MEITVTYISMHVVPMKCAYTIYSGSEENASELQENLVAMFLCYW